jgi:hypothetical protein
VQAHAPHQRLILSQVQREIPGFPDRSPLRRDAQTKHAKLDQERAVDGFSIANIFDIDPSGVGRWRRDFILIPRLARLVEAIGVNPGLCRSLAVGEYLDIDLAAEDEIRSVVVIGKQQAQAVLSRRKINRGRCLPLPKCRYLSEKGIGSEMVAGRGVSINKW